jgi:uncharacterized protein (TIRG00374 family)
MNTLAESDTEDVKAPALGRRFLNVRTFVSFGLGFAILAFLATRVQIDIGGIIDRVASANPLLLIAAVVSFYATFPIRALRWRRLLRTAAPRLRQYPLGALTEIMLLGWFANCIVPAKLGDAYRAYLVKLNAGVSFSTTLGTILAERIVDVVILFLLMLAATGLSFGRALPPEILLLLQVCCALVVLVLLGLLSMRRMRPLIERVLPRRLHPQYRRFERATLGSFRGLPVIVALTGAAWGGEVARLYLVTLSLGLAGIPQSVIIFIALASALATTLPLTPAGLGFAESAIVGVFLLAANAGLAPGLDDHAAASIALLDRAISYWSLVGVGLVVYLLSKRK